MSERTEILIAGIGNIFQGDDAFGCEVARRLASLSWPPGVRVVDFGIRGLDLAYALLDNPALALLIDACPRRGTPGTLYVLEPTLEEGPEAGPNLVDAHALDPMQVLRMVQSLGGQCGCIRVVGCEPAELGGEEGLMGLSEPVQAAVPAAVKLVQELVAEARGIHHSAADKGERRSS